MSELRRRLSLFRTVGSAALACGFFSFSAAPAPVLAATTYTVTSNVDFPKQPASGAACQSTAPGNPCTLRSALQTVNAVGPGNTIDVPGNLGVYSLSSTLGALVLSVGATIEATAGAAPRIDGGGATVTFISTSSDPVTISGLSFLNGNGGGVVSVGPSGRLALVHVTVQGTTGNPAVFAGGPLTMEGGDVSQNLDGGVLAFGAAALNGTNVTHNLALGGITALSTLTMTGGSVTDNLTGSDGGGLVLTSSANVSGTTFARNQAAGVGGGIDVVGTATLADLKVVDNTAVAGGGGMVVDGTASTGTATMANSTLSGNSSQGDGGGIGVALGTLTLTGSTLNGNSSSQGAGGGVAAVGGTLSLADDTLTGNTAPSFSGGGITQDAVGPASTRAKVRPQTALAVAQEELQKLRATLARYGVTVAGLPRSVQRPAGAPRAVPSGTTLNSVTVAGNTAGGGGGGVSNSLGLAFTVHDSIVADNASSAGDPDCLGPLSSAGYNLESATDCAFRSAGDRQSSDAQLAPLAANGGPTNTMALKPGSPALEAGDPACPPPATDQRGVTRPLGARCDIGAYEAVPSSEVALPAPPITGHPPGSEPGWPRLIALAGSLALMVLISAATAVRS